MVVKHIGPTTNVDTYGYTPSLAMAIVFIILFLISTILHAVQSFMKNSPRFMIIMAVGGVSELIGWGGRIWSRYDPAGKGFTMQLVCLIFAPTFYSAALYVLLAYIINITAQSKSFMSFRTCKAVFIVIDVFSIFLQAAGGGIAATANTVTGIKKGANLALAGIILQLAVMVLFVVFGLWWTRRARFEVGEKGGKERWWLLGGILLASAMIIVRGGYRTAELHQGLNGPLATDQWTFLLDCIPISIATLTLNVFHPSRLLPGPSPELPVSREMEMDPRFSEATLQDAHLQSANHSKGY
ncbi:RTA1-domain-containing protein [Meredithblackwellia eburnea MCA 4105]